MKDFFEAMDAVGLHPIIIDEYTEFPTSVNFRKEPLPSYPDEVDLAKLQVISVTEPRATHRFDCATCRKSIHRGDVHKKWVYKSYGEFKSLRMHLTCTPGDEVA